MLQNATEAETIEDRHVRFIESNCPCILSGYAVPSPEETVGIRSDLDQRAGFEAAPRCLNDAADDIDAHREHGNVENEAEDAVGRASCAASAQS